MKVFLSWSGERSRALGQALRDWLPLVLQYVNPWLSDKDIAAGGRWSLAVGKELEAADFGILCLTRENLDAPWILFEAGALSKTVEASAVCPYLFDLDVSELSGPFSQFQAKKSDRAGTLDLIRAINAQASNALDSVRLLQVFEGLWGNFHEQINSIPKRSEETKPARSHLEVLEDLVTSVRALEHRFRGLEGKFSSEVTDSWQSPNMRVPSHPVTIHISKDFDGPKSGQKLYAKAGDLVQMLGAEFALDSRSFGTAWFLIDNQSGHSLTMDEARDTGTYFGSGEGGQLVLCRVLAKASEVLGRRSPSTVIVVSHDRSEQPKEGAVFEFLPIPDLINGLCTVSGLAPREFGITWHLLDQNSRPLTLEDCRRVTSQAKDGERHVLWLALGDSPPNLVGRADGLKVPAEP